jgi:hypothetical protein
LLAGSIPVGKGGASANVLPVISTQKQALHSADGSVEVQ